MKTASEFLVSHLEDGIKAEEITFYKMISATTLLESYYVKYPVGNGKYLINPLGSKEFRGWVRVHYVISKVTAKKITKLLVELSDCLEADDTIETRKGFVRLGYHEDENGNSNIYLYLNNAAHEIVCVNAEGMTLIEEVDAPILFEHKRIMRELAKPIQPNDAQECKDYLRKISKYVNVGDEDLFLVIAWLLVALNSDPTIDTPMLWINAPKGSGKSTATRFMKGFIDPEEDNTISSPENKKDFVAAALARCVMGIDNVSSIDYRMSDVYCRAITGGTLSARRLFSDNDNVDVRLHSKIILNGISVMPERPDLQDRCFPVTLTTLDKTKRKSNRKLRASFKKESPYILGALLYAISAGLKNTPDELDSDDPDSEALDVRMLDACNFVMRVADSGVLPFTGSEFSQVLMNKKDKADVLLKSNIYDNTVACIITDMADEVLKNNTAHGSELVIWDDTTGTLLKELKKRAEKLGNGEINDIPSSPQKLGNILTAIFAQLAESGIFIDRTQRKTNKRSTRIIYNLNIAESHITPTETTTETTETTAAA